MFPHDLTVITSTAPLCLVMFRPAPEAREHSGSPWAAVEYHVRVTFSVKMWLLSEYSLKRSQHHIADISDTVNESG